MDKRLVGMGGGAYSGPMGIRADIEADYHAALAALAWQIDLGADEAMGEGPTNAYDLPDRPSWGQPQTPSAPAKASLSGQTNPALTPDIAVDMAQQVAGQCDTLQALDAAAAGFEGCELRKGARAAAAGYGPARAAVLILCDPPSIEAEKTGQAMLGAEMQLLQAIFAAIGLGFDAQNPSAALHLAPVMPWPARGGGDQQAEALRIMRPFTLRRIALVAPARVVVLGHFAAAQVLQSTGMQRQRGQWQAIAGCDIPAYTMAHPSFLMKSPMAKRDAWADALAVKSALRDAGI